MSERTAGRAAAVIRPEDILVSLEPIASSARNSFRGTVLSVADLGAVMALHVDCSGIVFTVFVTRISCSQMDLAAGSPCLADLQGHLGAPAAPRLNPPRRLPGRCGREAPLLKNITNYVIIIAMAKTEKVRFFAEKFHRHDRRRRLLLLAPPWAKRLRASRMPFPRSFTSTQIPDNPFTEGDNRHAGVEALWR